MAFSNPFDDPQGAFYILRNAQGQFSLWPQQCVLPAGWDIVSAAVTGVLPAVAGSPLAYSDTDEFTQLQEAQ